MKVLNSAVRTGISSTVIADQSVVSNMKNSTSIVRPVQVAMLAGAMVFGAAHTAHANDHAWAEWTDTNGQFTVDVTQPNHTVINSTSSIAGGNSSNLDILAHQSVVVQQQDSGSLFYGRAADDADPTEILGSLSSNGRLLVIDRNGVFFGAGSRVDVAGIVATTGDITNADILDGDGQFSITNFGEGAVVNEGLISVADGGLAAFVAPTVRNSGVITAKMGKVALASGDAVTLDFYGDSLVEVAVGSELKEALVENTGVINAQGGVVHVDVQTAKSVVNNVINMDGIVNVSSVEQKGGKIILSGGQAGRVKLNGTLAANGKTGGGDVRVTGHDVDASTDALIAADAIESGNGGSVYVYGTGNTLFEGRVLAQGGAVSGNGGHVEISAAHALGYAGSVVTSALNGDAGSFLLDPATAVIHSGALHDVSGVNYIISADSLKQDLANNAFVTIQADDVIDVGTNDPSLGNAAIDLTTGQKTYYTFAGFDPVTFEPIYTASVDTIVTNGALTLDTDVLNFNKDLYMGTGYVEADAATINLNAKLYRKPDTNLLSAPVLSGNNDLLSTAKLQQVNVLSNSALIQQAIHFAENGDIIDVAADDYSEQNIEINKSLQVLGAGIDDTVMNLTGVNSGFIVTADNVTIDGFTFQRAYTLNSWSGAGVNIRGVGGSDVGQRLDNILIGDAGRGGNEFTGSLYSAVYSSGGNINDVTIHGNIIDGAYSAVETNASTNSGKFYDYTVTANNFNDVRTGVWLPFLAGTSEIKNNIFTNVSNVNVGGTLNGARIHDNSFDANASILIGNTGLGVADASGNWWGTTDAALINGKMIGSVDFTPYLATGTDTHIAKGFQGDFSQVKVTALGEQSSKQGRLAEAIAEADVHGTVTIGAGTYTENLTINKPIKLVGEVGAIVQAASAGNLITVTANDVDIDPIVFDGMGIANYGIYADGADGLLIDGNTFQNFIMAPIYLNNSNGVHVTGNTITGGQYGIQVSNSANVQLKGNTISGNSKGVFADNANNLWVYNNDITGATIAGVHVMNSNGTNYVNDVDIWRNRINSANGATGVWVENSDYATVGAHDNNVFGPDDLSMGNVIEGGDYGIWVSGSDHSVIRFNTVRDQVVGFHHDAVTVIGGVDNVVRDNLIERAGWDGISMQSVIDSQILNNAISDSDKSAITVGTGSNNTVVEGNILNNNWGGLWLGGNSNTLVNANVINTTTGHDGIYVSGGEAGLVISNNIIHSTAGDGIEVNTSNGAQIFGNAIGFTDLAGTVSAGADNVFGDGIRVVSSDDVIVKTNKITETHGVVWDSGSGIYIVGGNNAIVGEDDVIDDSLAEGNVITNARWDGVKVSGASNTTVRDNDITGVERVGIYGENTTGISILSNTLVDANTQDVNLGAIALNSGSNVSVVNNTISGITREHGIRLGSVAGANNNVEHNTIEGVSGDGVHVRYTIDARVHDNAIYDTGLNGVYVLGSSGVEVTDNKIGMDFAEVVQGANNIKAQGIDVVDSDGADVAYNKISEAKRSGIRVSRSDIADINYNDVWNVDGHGIELIDSDYVDIEGNDIWNVGKNGVYVDPSNFVDVVGNWINNAARDGIRIDLGDFADVLYNEIYNSGDDAIDINDNDFANIIGNIIYGADDNGIEVSDSTAVDIRRNRIRYVDGDGINVVRSNRADIVNNRIRHVGDDGIDVRDSNNVDVFSNRIRRAGEDGIFIRNSDNVDVMDNIVRRSGDDGIDIESSDNAEIWRNLVQYAVHNGIELEHGDDGVIAENDVYFAGDDGIDTDFANNIVIAMNDVYDSFDDGIDVNNADGVRIALNNVYTSGDDGIDVSRASSIIIDRNSLFDSNGAGIELNSTDVANILFNNINNGAYGLHARGADHTSIVLSGNNFTNNVIGARLESGVIDMTGASNRFIGGTTALQFAPAPLKGGAFAPMSLVDDDGAAGFGGTIGTSFFSGQSGYFVELLNGAFFAPGNPTILNGINATYDTPFGLVTPSDTGGVISQDVFDFLSTKFWHYPNTLTEGLFFFGQTPTFFTSSIDQQDILRALTTANFEAGTVNVTILGLPRLPGQTARGFRGTFAAGPQGNNGGAFDLASALNSIETAAGGEDGGDAASVAPEVLNQIESAADENQQTNCWSDATSMAQSGQTVNYSFSSSVMSMDNLGAAACGAVAQ